MKSIKHHPFIAAILIALITPCAAFAAGVVSTANEASLRAALAGGGTVTFNCDGVIALAATLVITNDTLIDGAGHTITISGNNAVGVFYVNSSVNFTLNNLTVANGRTNAGAGLYNNGGTVTLSNVIFNGNQAIGPDGITSGSSPTAGQPGTGGAIYNAAGSLAALNCLFTTNKAAGGAGGDLISDSGTGANGGLGAGGAIYSASLLNAINCSFIGNQAVGGGGGALEPTPGPGGDGGGAFGGAVYTISSTSVFHQSNCAFILNSAVSGKTSNKNQNYYRGAASGGAIANSGGLCTFTGASIISNSVVGSPASGGGISHAGNSLTISSSTLLANSVMADASTVYYDSTGSTGAGGGLMVLSGNATVSDSTMESNSVMGGSAVTLSQSDNGGTGEGGGIFNGGSLSVLRCLLVANTATGGISGEDFSVGPSGATGGPGFGGGLCNSGQAALINCTLAGNNAIGGPGLSDLGTPNTGGNGFGGAIINLGGTTSLTNCTLSGNDALGGIGGPGGTGTSGTGTAGNTFISSGTNQLINTIIAAGVPSNNSGALTDLGHNISSDASCTFSANGSLNNTDPLLGTLGNYGGPTQTIPLLAGSPAIDAADDSAAPPTDQRGATRHTEGQSDIGAYEFSSPVIHSAASGTNLHLIFFGTNNQSIRLLLSTNLLTWTPISTNSIGSSNYFETFIPIVTNSDPHFYSIASP